LCPTLKKLVMDCIVYQQRMMNGDLLGHLGQVWKLQMMSFFTLKMDELSAVSRAWINENKGLVQLGKHMGLSKRQTIEQLSLQVDLQLYDHGIYLSPALLKPILPMFSVFLLALTIITFIAWRFYAKRLL